MNNIRFLKIFASLSLGATIASTMTSFLVHNINDDGTPKIFDYENVTESIKYTLKQDDRDGNYQLSSIFKQNEFGNESDVNTDITNQNILDTLKTDFENYVSSKKDDSDYAYGTSLEDATLVYNDQKCYSKISNYSNAIKLSYDDANAWSAYFKQGLTLKTKNQKTISANKQNIAAYHSNQLGLLNIVMNDDYTIENGDANQDEQSLNLAYIKSSYLLPDNHEDITILTNYVVKLSYIVKLDGETSPENLFTLQTGGFIYTYNNILSQINKQKYNDQFIKIINNTIIKNPNVKLNKKFTSADMQNFNFTFVDKNKQKIDDLNSQIPTSQLFKIKITYKGDDINNPEYGALFLNLQNSNVNYPDEFVPEQFKNNSNVITFVFTLNIDLQKIYQEIVSDGKDNGTIGHSFDFNQFINGDSGFNPFKNDNTIYDEFATQFKEQTHMDLSSLDENNTKINFDSGNTIIDNDPNNQFSFKNDDEQTQNLSNFFTDLYKTESDKTYVPSSDWQLFDYLEFASNSSTGDKEFNYYIGSGSITSIDKSVRFMGYNYPYSNDDGNKYLFNGDDKNSIISNVYNLQISMPNLFSSVSKKPIVISNSIDSYEYQQLYSIFFTTQDFIDSFDEKNYWTDERSNIINLLISDNSFGNVYSDSDVHEFLTKSPNAIKFTGIYSSDDEITYDLSSGNDGKFVSNSEITSYGNDINDLTNTYNIDNLKDFVKLHTYIGIYIDTKLIDSNLFIWSGLYLIPLTLN